MLEIKNLRLREMAIFDETYKNLKDFVRNFNNQDIIRTCKLLKYFVSACQTYKKW